ncbi:tubulin binding cofactor C-domain-containing protein [Mycena galericulata]|nr:tubulin binding cofactor C-domain-containing protein [Mycena galericulata]
MSDITWSFSQTFSTEFQASRTELESRVESAKSTTITADGLQSLSVDFAKLTKTLADATGSLPSYDQRQYELQLKDLEKSIEGLRKLIPKSKFAFKRKAPVQPVQVPPSPVPKVVALHPLPLSSQSFRYLSKASFPAASQASDLTISDLDNCIVNLLPDNEGKSSLEVSALHIRNLTSTILLLPVIQGSVILHDLSRCIIVVGCHQFRMHTSSSVDVYLSIPSTPIIEHCSQIRFTSYPATLSQTISSNALSVQDFSHIKATPSPNCLILDNWPLTESTSEKELSDLLGTLLP